MEVSPETVVDGLLDEIKRLTMEIVMLRAALKTIQDGRIGEEKGMSD